MTSMKHQTITVTVGPVLRLGESREAKQYHLFIVDSTMTIEKVIHLLNQVGIKVEGYERKSEVKDSGRALSVCDNNAAGDAGSAVLVRSEGGGLA